MRSWRTTICGKPWPPWSKTARVRQSGGKVIKTAAEGSGGEVKSDK
jgi:hypothetical protein